MEALEATFAPEATGLGLGTMPETTSGREQASWRSRLHEHWQDYLAEALGLATFMLFAGVLHTLFEHPDSPVHDALPHWARLALFGLLMGCVTMGILYSPWCRRSGGHINPAVTWAFYRLGKIGPAHALAYVGAQFAGSLIAPALLLVLLGGAFSHPSVGFAATRPGALGVWAAFWAEFLISLIIMGVILVFVNSAGLKRFTGAVAGLLIALYIAIESPLSGMSLNPARSFGSAVIASDFDHLWIYFVAPPAAMLLAAEIFVQARRSGWRLRDYREGPNYPDLTERSRSGAGAG